MKARLPHDFIIKLKQYDLINVLFHISIYSSKLFHNSDDDLTAARRETLRLGSSVGQILIPGWFLTPPMKLPLASSITLGSALVTLDM